MAVGSRWNQLDHVRALAAFLVFAWHFLHRSKGYPVAFAGAPAFPGAALLDEGHFGVSVFMTLSGFLFAKLLNGKAIDYPRFLGARFLRLFPLLLAVFSVNLFLVLIRNGDLAIYLKSLFFGWLLPTWPNGGWSITAEIHFYLVLPFILSLRRKYPFIIPIFLAISIFTRTCIFIYNGSVQDASYWTIIGRIDQFLLGIAAFDLRLHFIGRHSAAAIVAVVLSLAYYIFDIAGGFYELGGEYPSGSALWIIWPTFEGLCCAFLISWYDQSFSFDNLFARFISFIGFLSYEIYLLHFFLYPSFIKISVQNIPHMDNFYVALAVSVPFFLVMIVPAYFAYRFVERPFERFKPRYVRSNDGSATEPTKTAAGSLRRP